jgi:phospholipid-binding lipoprotein MlaA
MTPFPRGGEPLPGIALFVALLAWIVGGCAHVQQETSAPAPPPASGAVSEGKPTPGLPAEGAKPQVSHEVTTDPEATSEATEEQEAPPAIVPDPLRPWNRAMYTFNDRLYFWVLKPVAKAYKAVLPSPVRTGVKNFFHNLATVGRLVNDVLQGKGHEAGIELGSFMINSTFGLLGLVDWTSGDPEMHPPAEDTGQTLGRYGVGPGPFIMWPVLGPSTLRDSVGQVGDFFLDPVWYVKPWTASAGITAERTVNDVSYRIGDYEALKEAAIDPYEAVRDAYLQHRASEIKK